MLAKDLEAVLGKPAHKVENRAARRLVGWASSKSQSDGYHRYLTCSRYDGYLDKHTTAKRSTVSPR